MAENITNELIYEVLKQIQERLARVESVLADHTRQFIRVREDINSVREDINGLRGRSAPGNRAGENGRASSAH
jgi:hypothetical protein